MLTVALAAGHVTPKVLISMIALLELNAWTPLLAFEHRTYKDFIWKMSSQDVGVWGVSDTAQVGLWKRNGFPSVDEFGILE